MYRIASILALGQILVRAFDDSWKDPAIDPRLGISTPTIPVVTEVDLNLRDFDRPVLRLDGEPYFFNGVQVRADKIAGSYFYTDQQLQEIFYLVAQHGFTTINTPIWWSHVQPDTMINASRSTYIIGGDNKDNNYANSATHFVGHAQDLSQQALVYLKFEVSKYLDYEVSGAKIRLHINSTAVESRNFTLSLYQLSDNHWDASNITWSNAPCHHGDDYDVSAACPMISNSYTYDPISGVGFYDFDLPSFVPYLPFGKTSLSFIVKAESPNGQPVGVDLDGANGLYPPMLVLSSSEYYDWTYLDKVVSWVRNAGLKMEMLWFGSDTTNSAVDQRLPHYVFSNTKMEKVDADGSHSVVFQKGAGPAVVYQYLMDKNDLTLRAQEKRALKTTMDHLAAEYADSGVRTVVGVQVANEPSFQVFVQKAFDAWHNPTTWSTFDQFQSIDHFGNRTLWEHCINLANAVKESKYPVWTRQNEHTQGVYVPFNELLRRNGGTSLDFVGQDPYRRNTVPYEYGHTYIPTDTGPQLYAQGDNFLMIMENGGEYQNLSSVIFATLAGGSTHNVYDFLGPDGHGIYIVANATEGNYTAIPGSSDAATTSLTNAMLKKVSYDLSTLKSKAAGGSQLTFFNSFRNSTGVEDILEGLTIGFDSDIQSGGIAILHSDRSLALLATNETTFTVSGMGGGKPYAERGTYEGQDWSKEGDVLVYEDAGASSLTVAAFDCVRLCVN